MSRPSDISLHLQTDSDHLMPSQILSETTLNSESRRRCSVARYAYGLTSSSIAQASAQCHSSGH